jgi:hypothetical protein
MMMMKKLNKYKRMNHKVKKKRKRKNHQDKIQKHHQGEYKEIILKVKSLVTKVLELKQEEN